VAWSETPNLGLPGEAASAVPLEGDIRDSLMAGFAAAGKPYEPEKIRVALESFGMTLRFPAEAEEFVNVGPDDPCKCESGRKFKDCHGY